MDLPELITFQIDRKLIDRARMKPVKRRDESVAEFYEFSMHLKRDRSQNDYLVKQSVTKDERAARVEMPILGNGKAWDFSKPKAAAPPTPPPDAGAQPQSDDVPF
jgi:hypothetical protein